ncbi:hypothetical protein EMIT0P171_30296 [Pseudomonas sp. IT-P171]
MRASLRLNHRFWPETVAHERRLLDKSYAAKISSLFMVKQKTGAFSARFHSLLRLRPQSSTDHIHQVTTIPQRNGQQLRKVLQHHRVATKLGAVRDVFQYLRYRADAVISGCLQNVEWSLGVDEQGGWNQVDSSEGHVSFHR